MSKNPIIGEMLTAFIGVMVLASCLFAFILGAVRAHDGCSYDTIASYHPAYFTGCELFKPRFSHDQP